MKFAVLRVSLCALALAVAGCANIGLESKKIDYKSASKTNVPTLEIPPDLTSPTRDNRFAVPDTGGKGSATYSQYSGERTLAKEQQHVRTETRAVSRPASAPASPAPRRPGGAVPTTE